MRQRRRRGIAMVGTALASCAWLALMPRAARTDTHKIEVRTIDAGYVLGKPGLKVRLTLQTGEALEFRTDDRDEAETLLRMAAMFVSGGSRMFAEVEGTQVRAVQVSSGPVFRTAQATEPAPPR